MKKSEAVTPGSVAVRITAELVVDIASLYFDTEKKEFRQGDLPNDLIGELVAVKSGVYENAVWGNISSIVAVTPTGNTEPPAAEPPRTQEQAAAEERAI